MKLSTSKYYIIGGLLTILGVTVILYPICIFDLNDYARSKESLILIKSELAVNPEYIRKSGNNKSSGSRAIRLKLQGYPRIYFDNDGVLLDATDYKSILSDIKMGDTVCMLVLTNELAKFGTPEIPQSFSEQLALPPYIEFYSLRFKDKEYIKNIDAVAKMHRKGLIIPFAIFGSIFLFFGLRYALIKR